MGTKACKSLAVAAGIVSFLVCRPAFAGTIVPEPQIPGYVHEVFTFEDGLPRVGLNDVLQTADGYLWIATFDGLVRFDGVVFERFDSTAVPALASNRILRLFEDRGATLWIRTEQRHLIRYVEGVFRACVEITPERIDCDATEAGPGVLGDLLETPEGVLWAGGIRGLYRWTDGSFLLEPSAPRLEIESLTVDGAGRLWFAAANLGWYGVPGRFETIDPGPNAGINGFAEDAEGRIWVGGSGDIGLAHDGRIRSAAEGGEIVNEPDGTVWASVEDRLMRLRDERFEVVEEGEIGRHVIALRTRSTAEPPSSSAADAAKDSWIAWGPRLYRNSSPVTLFLRPKANIMSMFRDRDGTIWFAVNSGELHALHPKRLETVSAGLTSKTVYPIYEDRDGTLWAGGDRMLAALKPGEDVFHSFPGPRIEDYHPAPVDAMLRDRQGRLWVGSQDGLHQFDGETYTGPFGPGGSRSVILALLESRDGKIWIGTRNGLYRYDPAHERPWVRYGVDDGVPNRFLRVLHEAADGSIWIGTNGAGVIRFREPRDPSRDVEVLRIDTTRGLSSDLVRAIWPSPLGDLWIATENRGLNRLDPASVEESGDPTIAFVSRRHGLYSDGIHQIVADDFGDLWMSSNDGIFRVRMKDLEAVADGRLDRLQSIAYTERDGMLDREANGGVFLSGLRDREGNIWFPTMEGVVRIDPREQSEPVPPRAVVTALRSNRETLDLFAETRLGPDQRSFEISFTAPSFRAPERLRFRYRLLPYDSEWIEIGNRRTAFYTRVPPGHYRFEVAVAEEGVWGPTTPRNIEVTARFFETRVFFLAAFAALLCGVVGAVRRRDAQARARQQELELLVEKRTATVTEQAERLRELDRVKSQLFANVSHELRTPLTLLLGPLRDATDGAFGPLEKPLAEQLVLAENQAARLLELVDQLLAVARLDAGRVALDPRPGDPAQLLRERVENFLLLAERRRITLSAIVPKARFAMNFDAEALTKAIDNLLVNALDFTPSGGAVEARLDRPDSKTVRIQVSDDGPGVPTDQLEQIFERFHQVEGGREKAHRRSGSGLGLALARQLVELHGGSVSAALRPEQGTTFTILLPLGETTMIENAADEVEVLEFVPSEPPDDERASTEASEDVDPATEDERALILVVDDHEEIRAYLRRHLEDVYRVREAANGREALIAARRERPDLVISDVMMPEMDGDEFFRALREDDDLSIVPVVQVTAKASPESRFDALAEGVDEYLVKPFDPRELLVRVENLLSARRRLSERLGGPPRGLEISEIDVVPADRAFLRRVRRTIEERLHDSDLTVAELAASIGCDRTHLRRKLRDLIDVSPSELLRSMRLQRAEQLLASRAGTVSEVAYQVGFKTVAHFSNAFLERYGERPSAYARRKAD